MTVPPLTPDELARIGELYRRSTEKYLAASDPDATLGRSGPMDSDVQRRVRDSAARWSKSYT